MAAPNPVRIIPATSGNLRAGGEYVIRDEFTTDRAAGAVNGTASEPGPGTRTVVDTESKLTIAGGALTFAGGKASPSWVDPQFSLSKFTGTAGRISLIRFTPSQADRTFLFGILADTAGTLTAQTSYMIFSSAGMRFASGVQENTFGAFSAGTAYQWGIILRATGCFYFIKGGDWTYWTLLYARYLHSNTVCYPFIQNYSATFTADSLRVPLARWLPIPLVSHGFSSAFASSDGLGHAEGVAGGIGAGGSGVTFSNAGSTWSVSGGKAINTPVPSVTELVTNGNMETGDPPTGWGAAFVGTLSAQAGSPGGSGSKVARVAYVANNNPSIKEAVLTANKWYRLTGWMRGDSTRYPVVYDFAGINIIQQGTSSSTWQAINATGKANGDGVRYYTIANGAGYAEFDDLSQKELTLTELLSIANLSCADVLAGVAITRSLVEYQAGLALNWDSATVPANGIVVYLARGSIYVDKCVAGIWSNVSTTAYTYSAGARLVVVKNGTEYRTYYNNALIKANTIADAGILSNTFHGLFSTDSSSSMDDYVVYATGSSGEWSALDAF